MYRDAASYGQISLLIKFLRVIHLLAPFGPKHTLHTNFLATFGTLAL